MNDGNQIYELSLRLKEREKELKCIYQIDNILKKTDLPIEDIFKDLLRIIPDGWQFPNICAVEINFESRIFKSPYFSESKWNISSDIVLNNHVSGYIKVYYKENVTGTENPFLEEEYMLISAIAMRVSIYLFHHKLSGFFSFEKGTSLLKNDPSLLPGTETHWKWRDKMIRSAISITDYKSLGIYNIYLAGSTKTCTAGPASDIDIIVHFSGLENNRMMIINWFKAWSHCLSEWNYEKTGIFSEEGLIDLHLITDEDIKNKTSFAVMIGSLENSARLIK